MRKHPSIVAVAVALMLSIGAGCSWPGHRPGSPLARTGDEIMAAGQLFHTGTRVVLFCDPKGYDAYRAEPVFEPPAPATRPARGRTRSADQPDPVGQRYNQRSRLSNALQAAVATHGWTLENLQAHVDQFVIHYDVAGTSRLCFKVLQDLRNLSVPFMLDVDGTVYQTLDLKERAWHATVANDRSVGIEIAHMGAYSTPEALNRWYALDETGWPYCLLPGKESGVLTPGFIGRPARKEIITGQIHGRTLYQYDFTHQQYEALIRLTAALHRVLPRMKIDVPRNPDGTVRTNVLTPQELADWSGLIGHYHVQTNKTDPGPAFDWDRVITGARRL
ncbi:MAG: N-acetylmuramoyl-L-alanine amidase [Phycisphaerae bacterium]|jgi:N-acetyl-anhydromuramyl-L-alanine amidase AmpD